MIIEVSQHAGGSGEDIHVLNCAGELDIETVPDFTISVQRILGEADSVALIDLSATTFIDSTGLAAIIAGHKFALEHDSHFAIVAGNPRVEKLIEATGIAGLIPTYVSRAEAVAAR